MPDLTAKRTLVKSPPELWEELSEVDRLAKHLSAFGEITITKLEPEHTVAWEGEHVSGTVSIEPSGWGTKVTLRAELPEAAEPEATAPQPEPEPEPVEPKPVAVEPEPEPEPEGERTPPRGFWGWLFRSRRWEPLAAEVEAAVVEPEPVEPEPEPEPVEPEPEPVTEAPEAGAEPAAAEPEPDVAPVLHPDRARLILDEALDTLGAAHHRPFSRG